MKLKFLFPLLWLSTTLVLVSCDDNVVFEENAAVEGGVWNIKDGKSFEFDVQDTNALFNFYVNVRNGEEYAYSNLFVFVEMEFPNGKKSIDTLECPLADAYGNWYGRGLGKIFDNRILFRERKRFPLSGHYKIGIYQAMRTDDLPGIYDVGFRLAKSN